MLEEWLVCICAGKVSDGLAACISASVGSGGSSRLKDWRNWLGCLGNGLPSALGPSSVRPTELEFWDMAMAFLQHGYRRARMNV